MPHAEATAHLPVDTESLWQTIGSFQGVGDWHPMLSQVEGQGETPGATRTATAKDGTQQVERLQEIDPAQHFYRYTMESTAMPVTNYVAEFRIQDQGDGTSTVHWSADFQTTSGGDDQQAVDMVQGFLAAGLDELERRHS